MTAPTTDFACSSEKWVLGKGFINHPPWIYFLKGLFYYICLKHMFYVFINQIVGNDVLCHRSKKNSMF